MKPILKVDGTISPVEISVASTESFCKRMKKKNVKLRRLKADKILLNVLNLQIN